MELSTDITRLTIVSHLLSPGTPQFPRADAVPIVTDVQGCILIKLLQIHCSLDSTASISVGNNAAAPRRGVLVLDTVLQSNVFRCCRRFPAFPVANANAINPLISAWGRMTPRYSLLRGQLRLLSTTSATAGASCPPID